MCVYNPNLTERHLRTGDTENSFVGMWCHQPHQSSHSLAVIPPDEESSGWEENFKHLLFITQAWVNFSIYWKHWELNFTPYLESCDKITLMLMEIVKVHQSQPSAFLLILMIICRFFTWSTDRLVEESVEVQLNLILSLILRGFFVLNIC